MYKHNVTVITTLLLLLLLAAGCGDRLPPDPGLLSEDFGIGLFLGQTADQAREVSVPQAVQLLVLTGEEFAGRNPYDEREKGGELLVAVYSAGGQQLRRKGPVVFDPVVSIKGFLADEGPSRLTLFGQNMAEVTPGRLISLLGESATSTNSSDGSTHIGCSFSSKQLQQRNIDAMFSFGADGRCYAFEVSLTMLD